MSNLAQQLPPLPALSATVTGLNPSGSDGWEILHDARRLKAAGKQVIDLTIGDHDRVTPAEILDAMDASARGGHTGYAAVPGTDSLRDAIAERVAARTGVPTRRANVLVTAGGQAALFAALRGTASNGDTVLFVDPYYATYPGTIRGVSAVPHAIEARPDAAFQLEKRDFAGLPRAAALLVNTPNNPTGVVYTPETLDTVAAHVISEGQWLISDEVYDGHVWSGRHVSPRALPGMAERTLVIGSMSKSHAMTGSRIGWLVGPERVIERLAELLTVTTYGVPGFIQDAAEAALRTGDAIEADLAATYRRRRDLALAALEGTRRLAVVPPDGAMYIMVDVRRTGLSGDAFARRLLEAEGVAVMPGESFGRAAAGHVRVALTAAEASLAGALARLSAFAAAQ